MKVEDRYICDKCGTFCTGNINALTIIFKHPYENLGRTHFCKKCKEEFKTLFKRFTKIKTIVAKQGWKSIKLL